MASTNPKLIARLKRRRRIRKKISGTASMPRLAVFRSARHIYAQLIDDENGVTLAAASSQSSAIKDRASEFKGKTDVAKAVGKEIAASGKAKGIEEVAFDRGGFLYHGRVKALADGAREGGLKF
jgi:large subunit ribosomal protein L18